MQRIQFIKEINIFWHHSKIEAETFDQMCVYGRVKQWTTCTVQIVVNTIRDRHQCPHRPVTFITRTRIYPLLFLFPFFFPFSSSSSSFIIKFMSALFFFFGRGNGRSDLPRNKERNIADIAAGNPTCNGAGNNALRPPSDSFGWPESAGTTTRHHQADRGAKSHRNEIFVERMSPRASYVTRARHV